MPLRVTRAIQGFEADALKVIHKGKVLKDDVAIKDAGLSEGEFIVCMAAKKKRAAAPAAAAPAAPAPAGAGGTSAPAASAAAAPAASAAPATTPAAASASATASSDASSAAGGMVVGEAAAEVVATLSAMGFPEDAVRRALRAAYNNPDRAVHYLTHGIPDDAPGGSSGAPAAPPAPATASAAGTTSGSTAATAAASSGGADPLAALRSHPQLNDLRRLVQRNPSALPGVIAQIGRASPAILSAITSNREAFVAMLNEPPTDGSGAPAAASAGAAPGGSAAAGLAGLGAGGGDGPGEGTAMLNPAVLAHVITSMPAEQRAAMASQMGATPEQLVNFANALTALPPQAVASMIGLLMRPSALGMGGGPGGEGAGPSGEGGAEASGAGTTISLSAEDAAAVERLQGMGFPRARALEAFLACDKNEELAANFLLNNMDS